jgi:HlyD family secretion protein
VKKGQVLARLDPSQLQAQLNQAEAALAQAQAQAGAQSENANGAQSAITVAQANSAAQAANAQAAQAGIATADANVAKAQSALTVANQTVARDKALLANGYISQSQYDSDQSNAVAAQSALKSAQAAATQARAQAAAGVNQAQAGAAQSAQSVAQAAGSQYTAQAASAAVQAAQAVVQQDQDNLQHAVITSPVDGTVIAREVSVGQTVAASLQTPTLFSIAQDLHKMEVDIAVGEPDIGNVKPGDPVTFSVLAYPNQTFKGVVSQLRENPTTVSNVVTYTVITLVDNPNNQLMPGMTANASIGVKTAKNALVVPTSALTWRPTSGTRTHNRRTSSAQSATNPTPWGQTSASASGVPAAGGTGTIFVQRNGKLSPVHVKIGLVSGTQVAVTPLRGDLSAGDSVITGDSSQSSGSARSQRSGSAMGGPAGAGGIGRALR